MNALEAELVTVFFPLPGLAYDGEPGPLGELHLFRFDLVDWKWWEQRTVFDDEFGYAYGLALTGRPTPNRLPWGLLTRVEVQDLADMDEVLPTVSEWAGDVVLALRLYSPGDFLDPTHVCRYLRSEMGLNVRAPGPYRQTAYDYEPTNPYALEAGDIESVDAITEVVHIVSAVDADASLELALENFRYSFGPLLDDHARLALLFTTLDAIVGRMSSRVGGMGAPERVVAAMGAMGVDDDETVGFVTESMRDLRNRVAHAGPAALRPDDADAVEAVERAARGTLLTYLFYLVGQDEATASAGPSGPGRTAFNEVLAAAAGGDVQARSVLSAEQPT